MVHFWTTPCHCLIPLSQVPFLVELLIKRQQFGLFYYLCIHMNTNECERERGYCGQKYLPNDQG